MSPVEVILHYFKISYLKSSTRKFLFDVLLQDWLAYEFLPRNIFFENAVVHFENNQTPQSSDNHAFCQVRKRNSSSDAV